MKVVLTILRDEKFNASPFKCTFGVDLVFFLGYVIFAYGIQVDNSRIKAICNLPISLYYF